MDQPKIKIESRHVVCVQCIDVCWPLLPVKLGNDIVFNLCTVVYHRYIITYLMVLSAVVIFD